MDGKNGISWVKLKKITVSVDLRCFLMTILPTLNRCQVILYVHVFGKLLTHFSFQWPMVEPFAGLVAFRQVGFEICNSLGKKSPRRKALLGFLEGWKSTLGPCFGIPTFQHRTKRAQSKSTIWWWLVLCVIASECNIYIWITHIYDLCMCIRCSSFIFVLDEIRYDAGPLYLSGTCCWIVHTWSVQEYITTLE